MAKRIVIVEKEKCNPSKCGNWCIKACPVNREGSECIVPSEDGKVLVDEGLCIGCGICVKCPFGALHVINLPEKLSQEPIHRYSKNGFELFSLPTPIFGKVVGIIGANGIGKTTAIQALSGILKPNFGEEKEATYQDLIEHFKGTEAQKYFEMLRDKKIKISYKPQQVDLIPKQFKGKVIDLLKKTDEKNKLDEIAEKLELKEILETDIAKISGGELQRVAIAAAVLKKANLYVFDEPTSYLDIKQRLKVSRFIKGLADEKTAVLLVEHDLIILDYMADLIHIMYGKPACYGIVSQPKTTKAGINVYLSGYLKEENVRFRENKIKFEKKPLIKKKSDLLLTSWEDIEIKLGKFFLKAEKGELYRREVVGVLGANGIGKTTFVRILASDLKQDKGRITEKIKVSYKPQYLKSDSAELVTDVLKEAISKYKNQLIAPLSIEPLLTKQLKQLSGGELQRVAIAECLSKEADLYLLDEPSAYLDVEQRVIASKVIRDLMEQKGKSAIVVDHDLLFIDYLSQNLLVFDGKPAINGIAKGPFSMEDGMNHFLHDLGITFRRDEETNRPRTNKEGSVKDREQKKENKFYYS